MVALYMMYLHSHRHLRASTIRTNLSSIACHHQMSVMNSLRDSFIVATLLASYEKQDTHPRVCKTITNHILKKLLKSAKAHSYDSYTIALYVCLFSMYHALLQCSEVTLNTLNWHNLTLSKIKLCKSSIRVAFCSYKHSKAAPAPIKV